MGQSGMIATFCLVCLILICALAWVGYQDMKDKRRQ